MALYSAEIVFRDGKTRTLRYECVAYGVAVSGQGNARAVASLVAGEDPGDVGEGVASDKLLSLFQPGGRVVTINLDAVATIETSPIAGDKP